MGADDPILSVVTRSQTFRAVFLLAGWLALNLSGLSGDHGVVRTEGWGGRADAESALWVRSSGITAPIYQIRFGSTPGWRASGPAFESHGFDCLAAREACEQLAFCSSPARVPEALRKGWQFVHRAAAHPRPPDLL